MMNGFFLDEAAVEGAGGGVFGERVSGVEGRSGVDALLDGERGRCACGWGTGSMPPATDNGVGAPGYKVLADRGGR